MEYASVSADQLLMHIEDIETSIKIHKDLIDEILPSLQNTGTLIFRMSQNTLLENKYQQIFTSNTEIMTKTLLNNLLANQICLKYNQVSQDSEEMIWELDKKIKFKDKIIYQLKSDMKKLQYECHIMKKNIFAFDCYPTEQLLQIHVENERVRNFLVKEALNLNNNILLTANLRMSCKKIDSESNQMQNLLRNPTKRKFKVDMHSKKFSETALELISVDADLNDTHETPQEEMPSIQDVLDDKNNHIGKIQIYTQEMKAEILKLSEELRSVLNENEALKTECEKLTNKYIS